MRQLLLIMLSIFGLGLAYGQEKDNIKAKKKLTKNQTGRNKGFRKGTSNGEDKNETCDTVRNKTYVLDLSSDDGFGLDPKCTEEGKSRPLSIKSKQNLVIEIKNGNPFKYRYEINKTELKLFSNVDDNPFLITLVNEHANIVSDNANSQTGTLIGKTLNPETNSKGFIEAYKSKYNELLHHPSLTLSMTVELDKANELLFSSEKYLNKKKNGTSHEQLNQAIELFEDVERSIKRMQVLEELSDIKKKLKDLELETEDYISDISDMDRINFDKLQWQRDRFRNQIREMYSLIVELNSQASEIKSFAKEYNQRISEDLQPIFTRINKKVNTLFATEFSTYSWPKNEHGKNIDAIQVEVKAFLKKDEANKPAKSENFYLWITQGVKIDFSGGLFMTSLFDHEYFATVIPSEDDEQSAQSIINQKNLGNHQFGAGGMMNISFRNANYLTPSINLGSLLTQDQNIQLLFGVGLIFGKNDRVILHAGLAMGSVTRIAAPFKADSQTTYDSKVISTIPTVKEFKIGNFFGLTYNFGKSKNQNDVKPNNN